MGPLAQYLDAVRPYLPALSTAAAFVVGWVGVYLAARRTRKQFEVREFMSQVNFSINEVVDGQLVMRTLAEVPTIEVLPNEYGVKLVEQAAQKTTLENPFVTFGSQDDQDFVNRALLNVVSERFAEAYLARALGLPVKTGVFVMGLTRERYPEIRTVKLRVILIEEGLLREWFTPEKAAALGMKNEYHDARRRTLRIMHDLEAKQRGGASAPLRRVEIGMPV